MALFKSSKYANKQPAITRQQKGAVVVEEATVALPNTLAANDVVVLCPVPAGHAIVDAMLISADLDTGGTPAIVVSVGVYNDNDASPDLVSNKNLITSSTVAQAGGVARAADAGGLGLAVASSNQWLALKVNTAAATKAAGNVTLRLLTQAV